MLKNHIGHWGEILHNEIHLCFSQALVDLGLPNTDIDLDYPADLSHGDISTNVALRLASVSGENPRMLAERIADRVSDCSSRWIKDVSVAGPGFINLTFKADWFSNALVAAADADFGKNVKLSGKRVIVEYTDPNPFKVLHIGHLMSNTIGESLSRIIEWSGAETKRACYQGDVGMHVAQSVWGLIDMGLDQRPLSVGLRDQVAYLGKAYAHGATAFASGDEKTKEEIKQLNRAIYERTDPHVNEIYDWGREVSLAYFETQYKVLGTGHNLESGKAFDYYFFESASAPEGKRLILEYLDKGVFKRSNGAIVFPGEDYGLHTRVFLNSEGLPTYEAKELGLAEIKYQTFNYDLSVVVTGNEVNGYFDVLLKALSLIRPELQAKTIHIGHGMLRLPSGKMSSRTGSVIAAEDLLSEIKAKLAEREYSTSDSAVISEIAVGAIKYSILKLALGRDIVFDFDTSLSFEGDSGPYLQYCHARCLSVLRKAEAVGCLPSANLPEHWQTTEIERLAVRFPDVVAHALKNYSPHYIAAYLITLARSFNSWYAEVKIVEPEDPASGYRLALTQRVAQIIKNGLWLLGINAPERM